MPQRLTWGLEGDRCKGLLRAATTGLAALKPHVGGDIASAAAETCDVCNRAVPGDEAMETSLVGALPQVAAADKLRHCVDSTWAPAASC